MSIRFKKLIVLAAVMMPVAGCMGSSGGSDDSVPVQQTAGAATIAIGTSETRSYAFDSDTSEITVTREDGDHTYVEFSGVTVPGAFTNYQSFSTRATMLHGQTSTEAGEVFVDVHGVHLARNGETTLPVSGAASYTGSYAGQLAQPGNNAAYNLPIIGSAELSADFGGGTVTGQVTDRQFANHPNATFAPIELELGQLSDGSFSGTTTGGQYTLNGSTAYTADAGTYGGMIVGANGEEAIGQVMIDHRIASIDWVETGAFIVEQ